MVLKQDPPWLDHAKTVWVGVANETAIFQLDG